MRKALGAALVLLLALAAAAQDREKKSYELMYEDVQLLKQQVLRLDKKMDQAGDELRQLREQVRDLLGQFRLLQADQSKSQEGLRNVPSQFQVLIDKLSQIEATLGRLGDDVAVLKTRPPAEDKAEPAGKDDKAPGAKKPKDKEPARKGETPKDKDGRSVPDVPPAANLKPEEVYNTAQADYEKGNYDLAVDGFAMYRESFPSSPKADNALYMIGECYYSQKKFAKAVDALDDLIMTYPLSDKIAAGYLKKGLALAELKKKDEAVAVLKFLMAKYPLEEEAKAAQEKLKELQGK
jgi:tol-pal system protein YbgF